LAINGDRVRIDAAATTLTTIVESTRAIAVVAVDAAIAVTVV
jgi:predicted nuclease with RNAse H fold